MIHINSDNDSKLFSDYHDGIEVLIRVYNDGDIFCSSSRIEVLNDYINSNRYRNFVNNIMKRVGVSNNDS